MCVCKGGGGGGGGWKGDLVQKKREGHQPAELITCASVLKLAIESEWPCGAMAMVDRYIRYFSTLNR